MNLNNNTFKENYNISNIRNTITFHNTMILIQKHFYLITLRSITITLRMINLDSQQYNTNRLKHFQFFIVYKKS